METIEDRAYSLAEQFVGDQLDEKHDHCTRATSRREREDFIEYWSEVHKDDVSPELQEEYKQQLKSMIEDAIVDLFNTYGRKED